MENPVIDCGGNKKRSRRGGLRVLHIISSLGPGGAETLLYRLACRDTSVEHEVVCLGRPDWYSPLLQAEGVPVHHLGIDSLGALPRALARLRRILKASRADVIQSWMYRANVLGGIVARFIRIPIIWGIHCSDLQPLSLKSRALVYLSGPLARWIPAYIINCSWRSNKLHSQLGYSSAAGSVVPNGYDPAAFFPDETRRSIVRRNLGIANDVFLIGSIARWHAQKDIPNLLSAVKILRDRGEHIHCLLIGRGLDLANPDLSMLIARQRIGDAVTALGVRSDIEDISRAIDLHVLASCGSEAFPNVVAESMLSGTPNAVTDVGDSALIVGETGWVVCPQAAEQLADAIANACSERNRQPVDWQKRRKAARRRIADRFTFDRMADTYVSIWKDVAAKAALNKVGRRSDFAPSRKRCQ